MYRFYIDGKGYPRWKGSNILVHRSVAKNMFGSLPQGLIVHHIDGNKGNFRKNNLALMNRSAHVRIHREHGMPLYF